MFMFEICVFWSIKITSIWHTSWNNSLKAVCWAVFCCALTWNHFDLSLRALFLVLPMFCCQLGVFDRRPECLEINWDWELVVFSHLEINGDVVSDTGKDCFVFWFLVWGWGEGVTMVFLLRGLSSETLEDSYSSYSTASGSIIIQSSSGSLSSLPRLWSRTSLMFKTELRCASKNGLFFPDVACCKDGWLWFLIPFRAAGEREKEDVWTSPRPSTLTCSSNPTRLLTRRILEIEKREVVSINVLAAL